MLSGGSRVGGRRDARRWSWAAVGGREDGSVGWAEVVLLWGAGL